MRKRIALIAGVAILASACDSQSDGTTDPPPTPTVSLAVGSASGEITQAGTLAVPVSIVRGGGFTGVVTVTATGVNGVSAGSTNIASGSTTGTLTLTADAAAAPGSGTLTVTAAGPGGSPAATATMTLNVLVRGTYTLAPAATALALAQGASGNVNVAVNRAGGFAGAVTLAAQAPAGLTVTLTPTVLTGAVASAVLAVAASGTVAPGTYAITLTGATPGLANQTATVNVTVSAAGSFTLSLAPASLTLAQGENATSTITIGRQNGFAGTVNLTASAPAGITTTVTPTGTTGATATLNVGVGAAVAPGSYTVTVSGTADGLANQSTTLALTVNAAGSYTLALSPAAASVQQGAATSATVSITRTGGFAAAVTLTATAPAGITVTFSPATLSETTTSAQMNVSVGAAVATGAASITVRANAAGTAEQSVQFALTVSPGGGGSGNVTWTFCGFSGVPVWVAVQDGDGPWTRVTGDAGNRFSFQVSTGRGGIAYVLPDAGGSVQSAIFHGTTAELQAQGSARCLGTAGTGKTVTGTALGVSALDMGFITLGQAQAQVTVAGSAFTLNNVLDGPLDLVAVRQAGTLNGAELSFTPNSLVIQRSLDIPNGGTVGTIDFNAGVAPAAAQLTLANVGTDETSSMGFYYTPRNTAGLLYSDVQFSSATTRTWWGVPAASRQTGELHVILASAAQGIAPGVQLRQVYFVSADVANRTVTFGPPLHTPTVSVLSSVPYARLRLQVTSQAEYGKNVVATLQQAASGAFRSVSLQKTAAYVAAGGTSALEIPDFTAVAGWMNSWGLAAGVLTTWNLVANGWIGGDDVTPPFRTDGAVLYAASRGGQITP